MRFNSTGQRITTQRSKTHTFYHGDKQLACQLGQIPLRVGDSLLLAVGSDFIQHRNISRNFHVLSHQLQRPKLSGRQSWATLVGFVGVIILSTAYAFDANALPFVMAVAYGASACFLIPSGYQTHLMVYSLGRYRVQDYVTVGGPVSLVYSAGAMLLIPWMFPF